MKYQYLEIERDVISTISRPIFLEILGFVSDKNPTLWGEQQPRFFLRRHLILSMYKDMKNLGYNSLLASVEQLGFKMNHKSFQRNTKVLRAIVAQWAEGTIILGNLQEWQRAAHHVKLSKCVEDICLWMDSTDFPLQKWRGCTRKDPKWSYKLNRPGRRYMILRDGKGCVRKLWGGYSPKLFDGNFLELKRRWITKHLVGAAIVADTHFEWGKTHFKEVKFHVPWPQPAAGKRKKGEDVINKLTKEKETYNAAVKSVRARVEDTFGIVKQKFEALKSPWAEDDEQLDYLVQIAFGIYNHQH